LHLCYNDVGQAGARALAPPPHLTRLTWLALDGNPAGNAAADELLRAPWQNFRGPSGPNSGLGGGHLRGLPQELPPRLQLKAPVRTAKLAPPRRPHGQTERPVVAAVGQRFVNMRRKC